MKMKDSCCCGLMPVIQGCRKHLGGRL
jgi:hypothetical protein